LLLNQPGTFFLSYSGKHPVRQPDPGFIGIKMLIESFTGDLSGISNTGEGGVIPIRPYGAGQVHSVLKWAKVGFFQISNPDYFALFYG